jgi:hypothetical protein
LKKKKVGIVKLQQFESLGYDQVSRFKDLRSKCKWVDSSKGVKYIFPYFFFNFIIVIKKKNICFLHVKKDTRHFYILSWKNFIQSNFFFIRKICP